jgi:hypothetical protein
VSANEKPAQIVPGARPEFAACLQSSNLAILAAVIPANPADRSAPTRLDGIIPPSNAE